MAIKKQLFGNLEGIDIFRYIMSNSKGNNVSVINYGAAMISWEIKDSNGCVRDIITGFANMEGYLLHNAYFGCIVGRYANRIAKGKFEIDGKAYQLACNIGDNHLHGGLKGFNSKVWEAQIIDAEIPKLKLTHFSKDGEEGYPGNLTISVEYTYTDDDELQIGYFAETDKATHINFTNHCYFNLTGDLHRNILDHWLQINAHEYTPVTEDTIPTGEIKPVNKTIYDFIELKKVGNRFQESDNGYDLNYVLKKDGNEPVFAALLTDPENELQLSVYTTEPGIQLYTGNFLDGSLINKDGVPIGMHAALCLETQHFPDSPNHRHFPSTLLLPGKTFSSKTIYKITTNEQGFSF